MTKNILTLNSREAMDFFMKSEQYHGFELPEYFTFDQVLRYVRETIGVSSYEECVQEIISRMIDSLDDMDEKRSIIDLVYQKLSNQPNSSYKQLWLQYMTYTQDKKQGTSPYALRLCQLVTGNEILSLWNNEWLKLEMVENLPYDSIVNKDTLKKVTPVITFRETRTYIESSINESYSQQ